MAFDFIKDKNKKIHFIGIGGISMSGLAEILLQNNFYVQGSDMKSSAITEKLTFHGAKIFIGHCADNIKDCDLVIYTAAISKDNEELIEANRLNIPTMDRAEFLGKIMLLYKYNIAVAGTHGKTTTTSMISHISLKSNLDPTILVGGELDLIGGNVRASNSPYFITEACEYKESFLRFHPYIGIILNIDEDHLDYYKDITEIKAAFLKFANLIPKDGYLICNAEDANICEITPNINCNIIRFGFNKGDIQARNIIFNTQGHPTFDVFNKGALMGSISLNVPGNHNILNSLASICFALSLNLPFDDISLGLSDFHGTHRRFELKGEINGIKVIDDYAHHPTEIKATLSAAKNIKSGKIYCVFQPHTYTRTLSLLDEFATAFFDTDELLLAEIYAAREKDTGEISSTLLGDKIRENHVQCKNFKDFESIITYLNTKLNPGDILLTMGAGDIYLIGEMWYEKYIIKA